MEFLVNIFMNQLDKTKLGNNSRHTKTCLTKITIIFSSTIRLCSTFLIKKKSLSLLFLFYIIQELVAIRRSKLLMIKRKEREEIQVVGSLNCARKARADKLKC